MTNILINKDLYKISIQNIWIKEKPNSAENEKAKQCIV